MAALTRLLRRAPSALPRLFGPASTGTVPWLRLGLRAIAAGLAAAVLLAALPGPALHRTGRFRLLGDRREA